LAAHLHATIAALPDIRSRAESTIAKVYQGFRKGGGFSGLSRTYQPMDDDDLRQPPQHQRVQVAVHDELDKLHTDLEALFDATLTQEAGNASAKADVEVEGHVVLANAPVTYLLFLERQLAELKTTLEAMPTLGAEDAWEWDSGHGCFASNPVETISTQKTPRGIVLHPGTKEHPPQVHLHTEERPVGTWRTVKLSGALPVPDKDVMVRRVETLRIAVKVAREAANSVQVPAQNTTTLFDYLFDGDFGE
jgi:hypothetical protein